MKVKMHDVKCIEPHFSQLAIGLKKNEVRFNDRNYKANDILICNSYNAKADKYTGGVVISKITHVLDDPAYCKTGYVVLSLDVLHTDMGLLFLGGFDEHN